MLPIEQRWATSITRRRALAALTGLFSTPSIVQGQIDPRDMREHRRTPSLSEMVDAFDFEAICFANVPRQAYDYMAQSADSEWTKRRNRYAFDWVQIVESNRLDPAAVDPSTTLLGVDMDYPILVSPTAFQGPLHPTSEGGMYQGATAAGTLMSVSYNATMTQEEIAAAAAGPRWIQYYPIQNLDTARERLNSFVATGPRAIIITVDQQASRYDRGLHSRWLGGNPPEGGGAGGGGGGGGTDYTTLTGPPRYRVGPGRLWYTWDYMERVRDMLDIPVIIKGILTAEDAVICAERGFDAVIVSNHGARSLDYTPSTLEVLPEIVQAVGGRIPVLIDSGFRRGSDVFKAMALGADGVLLGRVTRWALGAYGPSGVQRLLGIIQTEFRQAMAAAGRANLAAIDATAVRTDFP